MLKYSIAILEFDIFKDRLDYVYIKALNAVADKDLLFVIQKIMLLGDGSANVECGFSINKNFIDVNH